VDAVDIDEAAVVPRSTTPRPTRCSWQVPACPTLPTGRYDVVLANILATPLKVLAPLLCGHVAAGRPPGAGRHPERQADELKAAYAPYASLSGEPTEDGWILMTARSERSRIPTIPRS
jgi:ribosomal protein L11 methyltransferase